MWNSKKSIFLSLILTDFFGVLVAGLCFVLPGFLMWYLGNSLRAAACTVAILYTFYPCVPFVLGALVMLHLLLRNLKQGKLFVAVNTTLLRVISWCCFAVALATLIGGCFYFPLLLIAAVMALAGLIVRVIKNVFHSAIELKNENDMTI